MSILSIMNTNKEIKPGKSVGSEMTDLGYYTPSDNSSPGIFVMKERKLNYRRSVGGMIRAMYYHQKESSKKRGHELPEYSVEELIQWCISQRSFEKLYSDWMKSNYSRMMKPSVDRIDDYKGYTFDNIRLVTWEDNLRNASENIINGITNKNNKPVYQIDSNDDIVSEYYSLTEAERRTGISHHNIWSVCNGKRKHAGNYKWKYKNN